MSVFSKACEYAIKACIYIAQQSLSDNKTSVQQVASAIDIPLAFTAKILQQLVKEQKICSYRGKQGGFYFTQQQMTEIKIIDIVKIIDGEDIFTKCGLGLKKCSEENPCPVHHDFKFVRQKLQELATAYTLKDLATKTDSGLFWLK